MCGRIFPGNKPRKRAMSFEIHSPVAKSPFLAAFDRQQPVERHNPTPDFGARIVVRRWIDKAASWVGYEESNSRSIIPVFRDSAVTRPKSFAGSKLRLAIALTRHAGMSARVAKLAARWQREAQARKQAAVLTRLSDHLLHDIGVTRDEIDGMTRRNCD
jgi:uncharacterized protein YjiS (DUF1127 family)